MFTKLLRFPPSAEGEKRKAEGGNTNETTPTQGKGTRVNSKSIGIT